MGVAPAQVGQMMAQAPPSDMHTDPLPLRSDPPREHTPRPVDPNVEHSDTATKLALGEAMTRMQGARKGEYQLPTSPLAIDQMKRAGLSDAELAILLRANPADATAVAQPSPPENVLSTMGPHGLEDAVNHLSGSPRPPAATMTGWMPPDPRSADRRRIAESMRNR